MGSAAASVAAWEARGRRVPAGDGEAWVLDTAAEGGDGGDGVPLLVLHGFPTCSFDYRHVLPALSAGRRVVLVDQLGFGLSSKPDRRYGVRRYADEVVDVLRALRLDGGEVDLLTHDVGDSVGGELLARSLEGTLPVAVRRRAITNGSIYMDLVQLSAGQRFLLAMADEPADVSGPDAFGAALMGTMGPDPALAADELEAQWLLASRDEGHRLLPRTIRYVEDRRLEGDRYTGAIETHPSPLTIVWGAADPIAVVAMAHRLHERVPGSSLTVLDDVGHFPMVEAPARWADAVVAGLAAPAGPGA